MKKLWITLILALLGFGAWSLVLRLVRVYPSPQRVAIAAMGRDLLSPVSSDFSKARYFIIVDLASLKVRAVPNPYAGKRRPVGLRTGELLLDDQVGVVLARGFRPAASNCLRARGIRVVTNSGGTAEEALQQYLQTRAAMPVGPAAPRPVVATPAALPAQPAGAAFAVPDVGLEVTAGPNGTALVTRVLPGTRAAMAGLLPGDLLVALDTVSLASLADLAGRLRAADRQPATLTLLRNNMLMTTRI